MTGLKTRIETTRFQECVDFYIQHLGMKVLQSWDHNSDRGAILGFTSAELGEAFLEIAYNEKPRHFDGLSLQFRVRELDQVVNRLNGVIDFRGPEPRPWGSKYLFLTDPNDISVIIYEGEL